MIEKRRQMRPILKLLVILENEGFGATNASYSNFSVFAKRNVRLCGLRFASDVLAIANIFVARAPITLLIGQVLRQVNQPDSFP